MPRPGYRREVKFEAPQGNIVRLYLYVPRPHMVVEVRVNDGLTAFTKYLTPEETAALRTKVEDSIAEFITVELGGTPTELPDLPDPEPVDPPTPRRTNGR